MFDVQLPELLRMTVRYGGNPFTQRVRTTHQPQSQKEDRLETIPGGYPSGEHRGDLVLARQGPQTEQGRQESRNREDLDGTEGEQSQQILDDQETARLAGHEFIEMLQKIGQEDQDRQDGHGSQERPKIFAGDILGQVCHLFNLMR